MFEKRRARRETQIRHRRLMEAALELVGLMGTSPAAPADLTALVFGRHCMEIGEDEAARYLDAARVQRGQRLPGEELQEDEDQEEPEPELEPAAVN